MARFRVRNPQALRERLAKSKRTVPHSVRSLAQQVGISPSFMGHLLTGERDTVEGDVAERISEGVDSDVDSLFEPVECPNGHGHNEAGEQAS